MIRFSVWLVICYAHVFVPLYVVIVTLWVRLEPETSQSQVCHYATEPLTRCCNCAQFPKNRRYQVDMQPFPSKRPPRLCTHTTLEIRNSVSTNDDSPRS